ncbi:MAG: class I SAM-dependent methyltransferase [Candidatus Brocadia sp.]|nr:class I SAM-dependent methyltransferase [Candidatus Brocadia sp.]
MNSGNNSSANVLEYTETQRNLAVRINAHKHFSNFSLEDWLNSHLNLMPRAALLDLGCGNGNLFPVFGKMLGESGLVVGIDKSDELLWEASKQNCITRTLLLKWDMNARMPFLEGSFDYVISSFAIYYIDDVTAILREIKRVLRRSGEVFLIGPADNNAKELYEFNKRIFGFGRCEKIDKRTKRLEKEFYPVLKTLFTDVAFNIIPSKLVFPGKKEFLEYYTATLLFEESVKKCVSKPNIETIDAHDISPIVVSKEMVILRGIKNE